MSDITKSHHITLSDFHSLFKYKQQSQLLDYILIILVLIAIICVGYKFWKDKYTKRYNRNS